MKVKNEKSKSEKVKVKVNPFLVFDFFQTLICFRGVLNLKRYINKNVQNNFVMGFKIW